MKQAELSDIRQRVMALARASAIGDRLADVSVEADSIGGDVTDFLRVVIELSSLDDVDVQEAQTLVRQIEDALAGQDDRFASVRFAEAA